MEIPSINFDCQTTAGCHDAPNSRRESDCILGDRIKISGTYREFIVFGNPKNVTLLAVQMRYSVGSNLVSEGAVAFVSRGMAHHAVKSLSRWWFPTCVTILCTAIVYHVWYWDEDYGGLFGWEIIQILHMKPSITWSCQTRMDTAGLTLRMSTQSFALRDAVVAVPIDSHNAFAQNPPTKLAGKVLQKLKSQIIFAVVNGYHHNMSVISNHPFIFPEDTDVFVLELKKHQKTNCEVHREVQTW